MAAEDWIDDFWPGDDEPDPTGMCKFCGNGPFYWHRATTGKPRWVFRTETGKIHLCRARLAARAEEFPMEAT